MTEEEIVEEVNAYEDRQQSQLHDDLVAVLSTDPGRRLWLWITTDVCCLNKRMPVGELLERMEGRRDVAVDLSELLHPYPDLAVGIETIRAQEAARGAEFQARVRKLDELRRNR